MSANKTVKKVVRGSFTMPENDHGLITDLQNRALENKLSVTKAEVLRAGLHLLKSVDDSVFVSLFGELESTKPGRPPKSSS